MIALYMDENVDIAITRGLRAKGVDVLTVQEDGRQGIPDSEVMDRANELSRVLFTWDDDLLREAGKRQMEGHSFAGVIYVHQARLTVGESIRDLEFIAQAGEPPDFTNQVLYLPL